MVHVRREICVTWILWVFEWNYLFHIIFGIRYPCITCLDCTYSVVQKKYAPYHCCVDLQVPGTKTVHEEQLAMVQSARCVSLCFFCVNGCQYRVLLSWQYVARPYVCSYVYACIYTDRIDRMCRYVFMYSTCSYMHHD